MRTWLGRDFRVTIARPGDGEIDAEALIEQARDPATLVGRLIREIMAGHSVAWDGSNMRGGLTEAAQDALERLSEHLTYAGRCPATGWVRWEPSEAYADMPDRELARHLFFGRETTDAEMREIAAREVIVAAEAGMDLVEDDVADYLMNVRDRLESDED